MTFRLSDELVLKLQQLPNPDNFVGEVLKNALKDFSLRRENLISQSSKWAKLMQRIDGQPGGLTAYSVQLQKDMQEFRENVVFDREG